MSDQTSPLPPVPQHTPPVEEKFGTRRFTNNWMQWFLQLRDKVNSINASLVSLGAITNAGFLAKLSDGNWISRTFGNSDNVEFTNGDGSGAPSADLTDTGVTADTYGDATHVPQITVDAKGRITLVEDIEITGGGGGGGSSGLELVGSAEVTGTAATSLTVNGLDLTTDDTYLVLFRIGNATASGFALRLFYNSDTTTTNYWREGLSISGATVGAVRGNDGTISSGDASETITGDIQIRNDLNGIARAIARTNRGAPSDIKFYDIRHAWTSSDNVTSITLSSTVASSLAVGSSVEVYKLGASSGGGGGGYAEGTSFPTSPTTDQKFYRTDLNLLCYYDGERWLTVQEYELGIGAAANTVALTTHATFGRWPVRSDHQLYITAFNVSVNPVSPGSAGNYWTVSLWRVDAPAANTLIATMDTSTYTTDTWRNTFIPVNSPLATTAQQLRSDGVKTGNPGILDVTTTVLYRLIVT